MIDGNNFIINRVEIYIDNIWNNYLLLLFLEINYNFYI